MKKIYSVFIAVILSGTFSHAKIIHVPSDQTTIQLGIDASVHGDTIVVSPGTYYENIIFRGKKIILTSKFYENNDLSFITSTIINGSKPKYSDTASCILIINKEDSTTILQGFTITGGKGTAWKDEHSSGTYREGGGLLTAFSAPIIQNNFFIENEAINKAGLAGAGGGAIRSGDGNPKILHNVIMLNKGGYGPAIVLNWTGVLIKNNIICNNSGGGDFGAGGIWMNGSSPFSKTIENNTIAYNSSALDGGGILMYSGSCIIRNNIIWGNSAKTNGPQIGIRSGSPTITYCDVQGGWSGEGNINTDPLFDDTSYVLQSVSPCVDAGDTAKVFNDQPDPANDSYAKYPSRGNTRNDMGAYGGEGGKNFFPFADAILSTSVSEAFFGYFLPGDSSQVDVNLTNGGSKILKVDSISFQTASTFSISYQNPLTLGTGNSEMLLFSWKPTEQKKYSDTVFVYHNSHYIKNPYQVVMKGIAIPTAHMEVNPALYNFGSFDINTPSKDTTVYVYNRGTAKDSIVVSVKAVGIKPPTAVTVSPKQFIIPPRDSTAVIFTFYPQQVIQSAARSYLPSLLFKSCLGDDTTTIEKFMQFRLTGTLSVEENSSVPKEFSLAQNFPNPFNPTTTISYTIPEKSFVSLNIFDVVGRKIKSLLNEEQNPGEYHIRFAGDHLSSGIYFIKIESGNFVDIKKCIFIK